jgi:hypothetical protein
MDTQEKTLAEQFRSMQIAAHRYLRGQCRKAAEETHREKRKEVTDKIFACLSEEEQTTMRSYLERVVEALKSEIKESDEDDYDFPFDNDPMEFALLPGFYRHPGGFGHPGRRSGAHGHGCERMNGFMMPF